ncbi:MAG: SPOR domain-containing protein [Fluviicola sp.]|nr:SPOR domain-containing protein [Fluviicola sp.]
MNNYLLQLLKEVKTIIIPGLGAITLTNEATGEMMFMPYLKYDDGNLANHIATKEGWELNDAKNLIAKFVREVTAELDKGNSYDMYQFGSFKKVDGDVAFDQWSAGTVSEPEPEIVPVVEPIPEPEVIPEPIIEPVPEPIVEPEPIVAPEPAVVPEPIIEPEPVVVPEPVIEPEPFVEPEPVVVPEPIVEPESPTPPIVETVVAAAIVAETVADEPTPAVTEEKSVEVPTEEPKAVTPTPPAEPKKPVASKEKLAAEAKKKEAEKKKSEKSAQPKKKKRVFGYILWGFVVLLMGGATYVALNFDTLKNDFPILADLAGENEAGSTTSDDDKPAIAEGEKDANPDNDSIYESEEPTAENDVESAPTPESAAAEVVTPEPKPVKEKPAPKPKPVEKPKPAPKPVAKPKPTPKPVNSTPKKPKPRPSSNSNVAIGSPDPSKPYHVIGGSFGSEANAKRLARQLIGKGQPSVVVGEFNGMYRVSIASFATEAEANAASNDLKSIVPAAWVFKWP